MSAKLLPQLLELGKEIYGLAQAGEWDQVRIEEMRRRDLIQACFPLDDSITDRELAFDQLQDIIRLGDEVTRLAVAAREQAAGKVSQLKLGRHATQAYQDAGSH
jgi:hypothetical protein